MAEPFAVFRRELQLFEILWPVAGKDGQIQRLTYATMPIAIWSVHKGPDAGKTEQIHIKGKPVDLISTGAVLTTENYPNPIPIVYCSKTRYFPASIKGIRVAYMDDLDASYFSKKAYGSKALSITFRGDRTEVVEEGIVAEENVEELPPIVLRRPTPYEPEECDGCSATLARSDTASDPVKVGSCLTVLFLFFLTAYLSNKSLAGTYPHFLPLNPFEETCPANDFPIFKDPYSAYYP
jgi:hypothetical protein